MTLTEDARGLLVNADLDPSDPDVMSVVPKMRRGDLTEMSLAFRATDDVWSERDTKRLVRSATVHKGDVSVVTRGASSVTSVGIRSLVEDFEARAVRSGSKRDRAEIEASIEILEGLLEPRAARARRPYRGGTSTQRARAQKAMGMGGRKPAGGTGSVETARLHRARMSRRMTLPPPRYDQAEVDKLGKEGLAHETKDGKFNFPLVDERDLQDALHAFPRASEPASVRKWIIYRAGILGLHRLLPEGWDVDAYKTGLWPAGKER